MSPLHQVKAVAEDLLYHWKTFPLVLPPPLAVQHDPLHQQYGEQHRRGGVLWGLRLFITFIG